MVYVAFLIFCFIAQAAVSASASPRNPYYQGSYNVNYFSKRFVDDGPITLIETYHPQTQAGSYPVCFFLTGGAGVLPEFLYASVLEAISSHGFIVNFVVEFPLANRVADAVEEAWPIMTSMINTELAQRHIQADWSRVTSMSHSAAGKVAVRLLQRKCQLFDSLILLDPVDGPIYDLVITPGQLLNFSVPALITGSGLGTVPDFSGIACTPAGLNWPRFFAAWNAPAIAINTTDYGHGDICDLPLGFFCPGAKSNTIFDKMFVAGAAAAFMKSIREKNGCDLVSYLTTDTLMPIKGVKIYANDQFLSAGGCFRAGCTQG